MDTDLRYSKVFVDLHNSVRTCLDKNTRTHTNIHMHKNIHMYVLHT